MEVLQIKLKNKASCLFVTDQNAPGIAITVQFKAGARFEDRKNNGVAHLLEHMIFKGTKKTPDPKELAFKIENLGANVNAWTSQEFTSYYISGPKENTLKIIRFLAELLIEPIFDKVELQKEKQVIFEEIRMYEDQPQDKVMDIFLKTLFGKHPLGRNIAGSISSVSKLNANNCIEFINNNYAASNMLLVISGDFDKHKVETELNNNFGKWPAREIKASKPFYKKEIQSQMIDTYKPLEQTHLVLGGYFPGYKNMDIYDRMALSLGKVLFAGGFGSMLMQKIREDLALSYYLYLHQEQFEETGYYAIGMGVNPKKKDMAITETAKLLGEFASGVFSMKDLTRAKNYLIGNIITKIETSSDLASFYARQILMNEEKLTSPTEVINMIKGMQKKDIVRLWESIIKEKYMATVLGPLK